jgi:hypothetical protein
MSSLLHTVRSGARTIFDTPALFAFLKSPSFLWPNYNYLELLGLAIFFYYVATLLNPVTGGGKRPHLNPSDWVVVTGATDGIGKEYALNFFRRGHNVLVLARSKEKVEAVVEEIKKLAEEIKTEGGWPNRQGAPLNGAAPEVLGHVADFSKTDIYGAIRKVLQGKEVGVLVNNVGMSYPNPLFFTELRAWPPNLKVLRTSKRFSPVRPAYPAPPPPPPPPHLRRRAP